MEMLLRILKGLGAVFTAVIAVAVLVVLITFGSLFMTVISVIAGIAVLATAIYVQMTQ
jgi:hypothetical protein